ncbi:hypothetical protein Lser_V15G02482 [Lactuca serriola]
MFIFALIANAADVGRSFLQEVESGTKLKQICLGC